MIKNNFSKGKNTGIEAGHSSKTKNLSVKKKKKIVCEKKSLTREKILRVLKKSLPKFRGRKVYIQAKVREWCFIGKNNDSIIVL